MSTYHPLTSALIEATSSSLVISYGAPAVAPTVADVTNTVSGDKTEHTLSLPATVLANELLIVFAAADGFGDSIPSTAAEGWSRVAAWANDAGCAIFVKKAVGNEGGTTLAVSTAANEYVASHAYRVQTWSGNLTDVVIGTLSTGTGGTATCPSLTSGFGAVPTLWIAFCGTSTLQSLTATPEGYTARTTAGSNGTNNAQVKTAHIEKTVATESPGTFIHGGNAPWCTTTVAVRGTG